MVFFVLRENQTDAREYQLNEKRIVRKEILLLQCKINPAAMLWSFFGSELKDNVLRRRFPRNIE
jgi:hypothetical protein